MTQTRPLSYRRAGDRTHAAISLPIGKPGAAPTARPGLRTESQDRSARPSDSAARCSRRRDPAARHDLRFFVGLHQPSDAKHFDAAFISVGRLRGRKSDFQVGDWILDSQAFRTIEMHGGYPFPPEEYADQIRRWKRCGNLLAAVTQDYMCEPFMLAKTGLSVADHQRLTIERYCTLLQCDTGCYIMPVLQGYTPDEYVSHIRQYGERLAYNAWVGVGSICKRNGDPRAILDVLGAIKTERPDLRLHGFGLKTIALANGVIRALLHTADSMAWSFAARRGGRNANDYREAERFRDSVGVPLLYQSHFWEDLI